MSTLPGSARDTLVNLRWWPDVKALFHAALERAPSERAVYLDGACGGDATVRREVESLLAAAEASGTFMDVPAVFAAGIPIVNRFDDAPDLMAQLAEAFGDRYTFARELARGGMSRVFVAEERALRRQVVVKVLSPELASGVSTERFAREVLFAARLQQANIVPVLNAGEVDGLPYYTMPYVRGDSLRARLASGTAASLGEAIGIMKDVAKALAYAHGEGIVHRDIKPENVLLSGGTAVVTDFGIAKAISDARSRDGSQESPITGEGTSIGTPAYMAPEQAAGDPSVGPQADVYSFGVAAYELLAGVHPFAGKPNGAAFRVAHLTETPRHITELRPDLPARLAALVMRCLGKDPAERAAHGAELLAALEEAERAPDLPGWDSASPSVAVLPFSNLSADPDNEYFSDGITDEVLSALTRMRGLRVAARTSSRAFKGRNVDLRTIGERLGVKTVLEGSVRRAGSRVRIAVQLVSASNGLNLWSERYDRELADIFAVQDDIAQSIAKALEGTFANTESTGSVIASTRRSRREPVNPDAFEAYLRGRHLVEQRAEGMHEALRCFEQAIRLDPEWAPAHAGIAYAFTLFGVYQALRPLEAFPRAREAADRALALDPTDALALVMRAHVTLWHEWDFARAEALARQALALAPGMYLAHDCVGFVLAAQGRFEEAIEAMQRARERDPLSDNASYDLAWILILSGRWEQAIREFQPAVARHPRASELRRAFGFCLFYAGRVKEAREEFERVLELSVGDRWGTPNLVQAWAGLGETTEAQRLVQEIEKRAPDEPISPVGIAIMHHWLGDDDAALRWLERSIEARDYWLVMLRFDPSMMRLRGNPRFEALMQRVRAGTVG